MEGDIFFLPCVPVRVFYERVDVNQYHVELKETNTQLSNTTLCY